MGINVFADLIKSVAEIGALAANRTFEGHQDWPQELWSQIEKIHMPEDHIQFLSPQGKTSTYRGALLTWEPIASTFSPGTNGLPCIGIDGSQIYPPDSCSVLFGWVTALAYQTGSGVIRQNATCLFDELWEYGENDLVLKNLVDAHRALLEIQVARDCCEGKGKDQLVLLDGKLLPWFPFTWIGRSAIQHTVAEYVKTMLSCAPVPIAGVISSPRSRPVINYLHLRTMTDSGSEYKPITTGPTDRDVFLCGLDNLERSALFEDFSHKVAATDKQTTRVFFFYLRIGDEIAKIEIPEWVARNPDVVSQVHSSIVHDSLALKTPYTLCQAHYKVTVDLNTADAIKSQAEYAFLKAGGRPPIVPAKHRMKGIGP